MFVLWTKIKIVRHIYGLAAINREKWEKVQASLQTSKRCLQEIHLKRKKPIGKGHSRSRVKENNAFRKIKRNGPEIKSAGIFLAPKYAISAIEKGMCQNPEFKPIRFPYINAKRNCSYSNIDKETTMNTPHTPRSKAAISQSLKGNKNRVGKVLSEAHKKALHAKTKGNKFACGKRSPESIERMRAAQFARSAKCKVFTEPVSTQQQVSFITEFQVIPRNYSLN